MFGHTDTSLWAIGALSTPAHTKHLHQTSLTTSAQVRLFGRPANQQAMHCDHEVDLDDWSHRVVNRCALRLGCGLVLGFPELTRTFQHPTPSLPAGIPCMDLFIRHERSRTRPLR